MQLSGQKYPPIGGFGRCRAMPHPLNSPIKSLKIKFHPRWMSDAQCRYAAAPAPSRCGLSSDRLCGLPWWRCMPLVLEHHAARARARARARACSAYPPAGMPIERLAHRHNQYLSVTCVILATNLYSILTTYANIVATRPAN